MSTWYLFYNRPSKSGRALANAIGIPVIKTFEKLYDVMHDKDSKILLWGVGYEGKNADSWNVLYENFHINNRVFPQPTSNDTFIDKAKFFDSYKTIVPKRLINLSKITLGAKLFTDNLTLVGRKVLKGSGGSGIFFVKAVEYDKKIAGVYDFDNKKYEEMSLEDLALCTQQAKMINIYEPKTHEYRYFVGVNGIISVVEKRKGKTVNTETAAPDLPMANLLRNHSNGYVFCQEGIKENNPNIEEVDKYVTDFLQPIVTKGMLPLVAFDLGYNKHNGEIIVYEGNTAPGLSSPTTLAKVVTAYKSYIESMEIKQDRMEALLKAIYIHEDDPVPSDDSGDDSDEECVTFGQ